MKAEALKLAKVSLKNGEFCDIDQSAALADAQVAKVTNTDLIRARMSLESRIYLSNDEPIEDETLGCEIAAHWDV